ncbi:MAG: hypothetical protein LBS42_10305 [Tannerella sp.]|nr:hypothetical protein [Tannerella sp.]
MSAKENLGKTMICCIVLAFAVTVGFWGCSEDYSPQIRNLNDRVDSVNQAVSDLRIALNANVSQLQATINQKIWVSRVEPLPSTPGGFTLVLSNGEEYVIRNGTNGTPGSTWTISPEGYWLCDGYLTDPPVKATGIDGSNGLNAPPPYINQSDTTWYLTEWNAATNKYDTVPSGIKASGIETFIAYVTGSSGNFTLHVKNRDNSNLWESVPLFYSGSASDGTIELLGYVQGNVISPTVNLSLSAVNDTAILTMDCWRVATLPAGYNPWNHGKFVQVNQILTTLSAKHTALVISTDLGADVLTNLKLYDSRNIALPFKFGAPVALSGYLTRSAGPFAGTIYYIPVDSISGLYPIIAPFDAQFASGTLYYLKSESTGVKSNFGRWTISAISHTASLSTYSLVDKVGGADDAGGEYTIPLNGYVGVTFDADSINVYDYYISYPGSRTGISFGPSDKTFRTTVPVTPRDTVVVHKLYVDGAVRTDTIQFKTP